MDLAAYVSDKVGDWKVELTDAIIQSFGWKLNDFGVASIAIDPLSPQARQILINEVEIQIWADDILRWWGIPRKVTGNLASVTFTCEEIISYFLDSLLTDRNLDYAGLDQKNIAANLATEAQFKADQNRSIVNAAFTGSGITRDRRYAFNDFPNIYELLQNLPDLQNGLDFSVEIFGDGRREFTTYYPAKGTRKPQYALELDQYGRKHIVDLNWNRDGMSQANDIFATGKTDASTNLKIVGHFEDTTSIAKYGRMQDVISEGEVDSVNWLNARAQGEAVARKDPLVVPEVIVSDSLMGLITTGDILPCRVDYGIIQLNGDYRINEINWRESGDMALGLQPA